MRRLVTPWLSSNALRLCATATAESRASPQSAVKIGKKKLKRLQRAQQAASEEAPQSTDGAPAPLEPQQLNEYHIEVVNAKL